MCRCGGEADNSSDVGNSCGGGDSVGHCCGGNSDGNDNGSGGDDAVMIVEVVALTVTKISAKNIVGKV